MHRSDEGAAAPNGMSGLAASWYVAMPSARLRRRPVPVRLFGADLVAWRGMAGRAVVAARYCPHQGASLAIGAVVDGCLRCPFHGWRFEPSGECAHIPGTDRIPSTARLATYPVQERYGYVWVWFGGGQPLFDLPDFPALGEHRHRYAGFRYTDVTAGTARQLIENAVDYFHFLTLHGLQLDPLEFRVLDDPAEAGDNGTPIDADAFFGAWLDGTVPSYRWWRSPARWLLHTAATYGSGRRFQLLVDGWPGGQRFTGYIDGREVYKVLLALVPTDERRTTQVGWALVRRTGRPWRTLLNLLLLYGQSRGGTWQDIPIYDTTEATGGGFHVPYDRGVLKFRRQYQHWVERAAQPARGTAEVQS
ncbi:Rieske 2Fe-2S domain-containing protein [Dactylosporangium sp. NPDC050688]|uniref:Rieske 2Fe-2S domain-containing protein n=1 Tax=Dactylosporangium sp. NPDC050688 TaxID=3157217 RepID=UPI0033FA05FA